MKNTVLQRIRFLINFLSISDRKFAEAIKVSQTTMSSLFQRGNEPNVSILQAILNAYTDISPEWLLTGNGEMLKNFDGENSEKEKNIDYKERYETLLEENKTLRVENNLFRELQGVSVKKGKEYERTYQ